MEHGEKVGMILTEELEKDTALSLMGMWANKRLGLWDIKNKESADSLKFYYDQTLGTGKFHYVNKFGDIDDKWAVNTIRHMAKAYGIKYIMLDHLGSIAAGALKAGRNERESLDIIMPQLANVVRDTGVTLFLLSHVNTPEGGKAFEEGGEVSLKNFRGSRSIGQWADGAWALIRNQKDKDVEKRSITDLVILKDRQIGGLAVGQRIQIHFDSITGRLSEHAGRPEVDDEEIAEFGAVEDKGTEIIDKPKVEEPENVDEESFDDF
jgi:twinkle protein